MKLAGQYTASITFFEKVQKDLRLLNSDCEYKKECFESNGTKHFKEKLCPDFKKYNFVTEKECMRAGKGLMDLVSGKTELAVPIRDKAQQAHNDRMYELEKEKLEIERDRADREQDREDREQDRAERDRERDRDLREGKYDAWERIGRVGSRYYVIGGRGLSRVRSNREQDRADREQDREDTEQEDRDNREARDEYDAWERIE